MPSSFVEEVDSGDRLRALEALRAKLARAIDDSTDARDLSSLGLRLQRVLAEIADLGGQANDEENDELRARRAAKLSAAADA